MFCYISQFPSYPHLFMRQIPANIGLRRSYSKIDSTSGDIILQSGLTLPSLTSAEVMVIYTEPGQSISREEMIGLTEYARRSIYIKQLR